MNMYGLLLAKKLSGGGGGGSTLVSKTITANGTYNPSDDNADGYSVVVANVPNTYTLSDEGKVVDSGALVSQTAKNISANGLYDTTLNNSVSVDVPNTYTASDNGKVVSDQQLVSQTAKPDTITVNDTYNTTEYNSVTVNVPNTYTASDEGKVVSNGALVSQTAYPSTVVSNGTYNTTLNNSITVNVTDPDFSPLAALFAGTLPEYSTEAPLSYPLSIGLRAVSSCNALERVTLSNGYSLGDYAFSDNANLKYVSFSGSGSVYGSGVFAHSPMLQEIHIPATLKYESPQRGAYMFNDTGLIRATVDKSTSANMFQNCTKLAYAKVSGDVESRAFDGCVSLLTVELVNCTTIGSTAFGSCRELVSVTNTGTGSITLGLSAFDGCISLSSVPFAISTIANYAFRGCTSLSSIDLTGVTSIGNNAFLGCTSLTSITIPNTVSSLGTNAFSNCTALTTVELLANITSIQSALFKGCSALTGIDIPSTVTLIMNEAFSGCTSLTSIKFLGATPPNAPYTNIWTGVPTTCVIYVPTGSLSAYTSASNYPNPNTYTYVEY